MTSKRSSKTISASKALKIALAGCGLIACAFTATASPDAQSLLSTARASKAISPYSVIYMLETSFSISDLDSLANTTGMRDCFSFVEKIAVVDGSGRVSAQTCVDKKESTYFINLKRASLINGVGAPNVVQQKNLSQSIFASAMQRLPARFTSQVLSKNEMLRVIIDGKLDIDFSPSEVSNFFVPKKPDKPTYSFAGKSSSDFNNSKRLASLGRVNGATIPANSMSSSKAVEYSIVEHWEVKTKVVATPESTPKTGFRSFATQTKQFLGLQKIPFSNFRLHLEKAPVQNLGIPALTVRFQEAAGLAFIDFSSLLSGNPKGIFWEFRIPYYSHAFIVNCDNLVSSQRFYYEYVMGAKFTTRIGYNPNLKNIVSSIDSALYTANLVYNF